MAITKLYENDNLSYLEEKIFKDSLRQKKLYNRFRDINDEQLEKIALLSQSFYETKKTNLLSQNYINMLNYLSTRFGKNKLVETSKEERLDPTYDELLAFIITSCDPECKMYKGYLSADNTLTKTEKYNEARKNIGFFSKRILMAEKDFYLKYNNQLLTNVKEDNSNYINLVSSFINSFDNISDERFTELYFLSSLWKNNNIESQYTTCIYNILHQSNLLGLKSAEERIIFFIDSVDPDLNLLDIYEQECKIDRIKERSLKELGFYNYSLIKLEKLYKNNFYKNQECKKLLNKKGW